MNLYPPFEVVTLDQGITFVPTMLPSLHFLCSNSNCLQLGKAFFQTFYKYQIFITQKSHQNNHLLHTSPREDIISAGSVFSPDVCHEEPVPGEHRCIISQPWLGHQVNYCQVPSLPLKPQNISKNKMKTDQIYELWSTV